MERQCQAASIPLNLLKFLAIRKAEKYFPDPREALARRRSSCGKRARLPEKISLLRRLGGGLQTDAPEAF
jgi:hypothetical protein